MSDAVSEAMISAMAQVNTALSTAFERDEVDCYLIKRREHSKEWTEVAQLTSGYFVDFEGIRDRLKLEYATTTGSFRDDWAEATHIAYGEGSLRPLEVFEMTDEKDTVDPSFLSPFWSVFAVKMPNERYYAVPDNALLNGSGLPIFTDEGDYILIEE